ncbi:hypothetical protein ACQPZX_45415 [Actinoplanes sp. CA-142083]|uniref:hypothetical protein n=1 Tax=Actinoplanes sp. CA-142083 TaxID=3239903 RepID=UPI003D9297C2
MGADAEIHVFDYDRYRDEVVPGLVELLRTGTPAPWLDEVLKAPSEYGDYWQELAAALRESPTDLAQHCTWLGDDLRYIGDRPVDRLTGNQMTCNELSCPERERCRYFQDQDRHGVETLNALHEAAVATRCLGPSRFLGRTITPDYYRPVLERQGVPATAPVRGLLEALATRGAAWGYQFGRTEGIHGWLTVPETALLAAALDELDLPRYEPTFAAMSTVASDGRLAGGDWHVASLSFVRTMATIAAASGQGVLWGNDVSPTLWTETWAVPAAGRPS